MSRHEAPAIDVYVRGTGPDAAASLGATLDGLVVEWLAQGVVLTTIRGAGQTSIKAQGAIIHEPRPQLYDALPLASFDASARRFWQRVFSLVKLPGGRYLLGKLARRGDGR